MYNNCPTVLFNCLLKLLYYYRYFTIIRKCQPTAQGLHMQLLTAALSLCARSGIVYKWFTLLYNATNYFLMSFCQSSSFCVYKWQSVLNGVYMSDSIIVRFDCNTILSLSSWLPLLRVLYRKHSNGLCGQCNIKSSPNLKECFQFVLPLRFYGLTYKPFHLSRSKDAHTLLSWVWCCKKHDTINQSQSRDEAQILHTFSSECFAINRTSQLSKFGHTWTISTWHMHIPRLMNYASYTCHF